MHFRLTFAILLAVLASALAFDGDGTYYNVGLGACGQYNNNNQLVAALNKPQFGSSPGGNPNHNPNCGRQALVHGPKGQVQVTIVDMCPACGWGSLDLSPAAFSKIADMAQGRVHITWDWV
ncbi:riboflavin aldehydeforming enzyme, putative [Acanthamoeba castellanii str. Neff]|uniref:Riboflavin aldehydeforming enzyme, putative n=1 Tax=Acanthamoeba castellanii (strain ATCC 30010 / Neff) TaxID=1257118 RepID=L8GQY2_ACACF|nr:riboflavin aldehydeforming enzyme, putative [Acanthamoeba castellanii str. Neff]ELR15053.1 riboflavin aldehydeforming enzyme, putative [Acanthamoeba castellanii str. Neff]